MSLEQEKIEKAIGSISKLRIIKTLAGSDQLLTIYAISKRTRLKREDIKKSVNDLKSIGWISETKIINNLYKLNMDNDYIKEIMKFFIKIGYMD